MTEKENKKNKKKKLGVRNKPEKKRTVSDVKKKKEVLAKKVHGSVEPQKVATSVAKYVRTSPRKIRLVIDAIRGRKVQDALNILRFTPKRAAKTVEKVLNSAVANAENNHQMNPDDLYICKVHVDKGPTMMRWIPRAMGRASLIHKRTSHITVSVMEKGE